MGKKGGSSWLTAVKRAFRSPVKDSEKRNNRNKDEQEEEEEKVSLVALCTSGIVNLLIYFLR